MHEPLEIDLWQQHFPMITLTQIMRQKDDCVKDKTGELSEADRASLSQTITEPALCPTDVLHIFATNKQVNAHNSATLAVLYSHITDIDADDCKEDPHAGRMAPQATPFKKDLVDTLHVTEGARVMLTRNIDVSQGLVNGSFCTLARIISSEQNGLTHVTMLGLKMDDETAGRNYRHRAPGGPENQV